MANMKEIKDALKAALEGDHDLMQFAKGGVFEGIREGIIDFPCLVIEPMVKDENDDTYATQRLSAKWGIVGLLKTMDKDSQLNDVFDFENLVLKALGTDRRLGGKAEHLMIQQTSYESELWPIRSFTIQIEIEFRQNSVTR